MKTKILLVEEDLILQFVMESLLESLNCEVDVCHSANEALKIYKKNKKYQLILTEIDFNKGLNGFELAEKIRAHEHQHYPNKRIPIIGMISLLSKKIENLCLEKGVDM